MINYNKSNHNEPIQIAPAKSVGSHQQEMIYGRIRSPADIIVTRFKPSGSISITERDFSRSFPHQRDFRIQIIKFQLQDRGLGVYAISTRQTFVKIYIFLSQSFLRQIQNVFYSITARD